MGLLEIDGIETFSYQESKPFQKKFKKAGLTQLLYLLKNFQDKKITFEKFPKFGFEIEGHLMKVIHNKDDSSNYQLETDKGYLANVESKDFTILPEYGRWMLELIPQLPMEDYLDSTELKKSICLVYKQLEDLMRPQNKYLSTSLPPKLGTLYYAHHFLPGLTHEQLAEVNQISKSEYMADEMINDHPRYPASAKNVRNRRGEKPWISAPIYPDIITDLVNVLPGEREPGKIHLDSVTFGSGVCSLQVTLGTSDMSEARWLYDQFHIFTPIWLALSASTPFHKGTLLNTDTRWEIRCQAQDDRNERERSPGGIFKTRSGPISLFISEDARNFDCYNDERKTINKWAWRYLFKKAKELDVKIDRKLLDHFSFLFVRDYLCIFERSTTYEPSLEDTKLFEGIQSSNWNDVRFKPPPSMDSSIGWRVEFRSPDVQLTPELNFLFSHSIQVLGRLLIKLRDQINFYIPMSMVTENFRRANMINAAVKEKFFFRTNVFEAGHPVVEELTVNEIFKGKGSFMGLQRIVDVFLDKSLDLVLEESKMNHGKITDQVRATFQFLSDIASGQIPTTATRIRAIIKEHPLYKGDSLLSEALLDALTGRLLDLQSSKDQSIYNLLKDYLLV